MPAPYNFTKIAYLKLGASSVIHAQAPWRPHETACGRAINVPRWLAQGYIVSETYVCRTCRRALAAEQERQAAVEGSPALRVAARPEEAH